MTESSPGYFRYPTLYGDRLIFVSEDDLWEVSDEGGIARRMTTGRGNTGQTACSPDGKYVAFTGTDEGTAEVYLMELSTSHTKKITHLGSFCSVVGWSRDSKNIIFRSNHKRDLGRQMTLYSVSRNGGEPVDLGLGEGQWYNESEDGSVKLIGRFSDDIARWKRYKGGTAGVIWIKHGRKKWARLRPEILSGMVRPIALNDRIYFTSDFEGYGELYSCDYDGENLEQHTDFGGFYVRHASTDGARITFSCGGDLHIFDPESNEVEKVEVDYRSPRPQLARKFPNAGSYLQAIGLHPKGHAMTAVARGKLFSFSNFDGGVYQLGEAQGVRYREPEFLNDGKRIVVVSDESGEERLEIHSADRSTEPKIVKTKEDIGRILHLEVSPKADAVVVANHRYELLHINLKNGKSRVIDQGNYDRIQGFDWSPDGRWIAYASSESLQTSTLKIVDTKTWRVKPITSGEFHDSSPVFDPKGRYLYFISRRYFEPVYDSLFVGISFPESAKPCVITLRKDVDSMFVDKPDGFEIEEKEDKKADAKKKKSASKKSKKTDDDEDEKDVVVTIDFDGIADRIEAFPVETGTYYQLAATEKRVFWMFWPPDDDDSSGPRGEVETWMIEDRKKKYFANAYGFQLSQDREKIALYSSKVRVISANETPSDDGEKPGKATGYVDLNRMSVCIEPREEWRQMLREAWRLMRDQFWQKNMSGLNWKAVWKRYSALVDRVNSRSEFSDLVWVMQGELGTSHAYEFGGDYRRPPSYRPAFLGADFSWDKRRSALKVERIITGDSWDKRVGSPLNRPGVDVKNGDAITHVDGQALDENTSLQEVLTNKAQKQINLTVKRGRKTHHTIVTPLSSESGVRYRQWVSDNRTKVHEATKGKVGYIHVPDMSVEGFAEFHRGFLSELRRDALIVDVRYNGGGNVSQLLLEKLARKRIGYDLPRHGKPVPYPTDSVLGPMVALTNEKAGSDGDIFSHCFKLMELGPLIGKRTWGGVIGIWPRHSMVDRSLTTQPEFSFWFEDVGFGVENYGTDPDIEIDISPDDYAAGIDPQLDEGIKVVKRLIAEQKPSLPKFGKAPNLAPPKKRR